jgi:cell division protease FtsH
MNGNWSRNAFVYLLIIVAAAALFINIYQPGEGPEEISLSRLATALQRGNVESVTINGNEARVVLKENGATVLVRPESDMPITETLTGMGVAPDQLAAVTIKYEAPGNAANWLSLLVNLLPLVFMGALFFFLFRQTQGSNNQALSFGKSKARSSPATSRR